MGKRGTELHDHILWSAIDLFLEVGFERTSMDLVAARAGCSKRTLYAHFESKENLYLAAVEVVRGLTLDRLGTLGDGAPPPVEALTSFCARYMEILRYEPAIQMCRVSISEAARFPQGAARHFDALFAEAASRIGAFLRGAYELTEGEADEASRRLLGRLLYPALVRALFGLDELAKGLAPDASALPVDLAPIRAAVEEALAPIQGRHASRTVPGQ